MAAVSKLVVAALIVREGEVLIVRQQGRDDPAPYWSVPGGVVEQGEFVHEALAREVAEETGLTIAGPGRLACMAQYEVSTGRWAGLWTALTFAVAAPHGDPKPADPDGLVLEAAWVPIREAAHRLSDVGFAPMREPTVHHLLHPAAAPTFWTWPLGVGADPLMFPDERLDRETCNSVGQVGLEPTT
ncbi:NUDIX hydrolase [Lentzea alba]|uniref:NUDIX domain-containing protein n=1 Tax=Lentzea alba TaxID=2714351 RepID=UPI0039BEF5B4